MKISLNPILFSLIFVATIYGFWVPTASISTDIGDILSESIWTEMESYKDKEGNGNFTFDTDSCQADNHWLFRPDGSFEMTEDAIKCEPDIPNLDTIFGTWTLKDNQTILSLGFDEFDLDFLIDAVGQNEIHLFILDAESPTAPTWEKIILRR